MVDAVVPEVAVFCGPQQGVAEDGAAGEVDRAGHVRGHPREGGGVRVRFGGEVGRVQLPVAGRGVGLPGTALVVRAEGDVEGFRLADDEVKRGVEDGGVHRALDAHVLGRVVGGAVRVELLAGPDAFLGGQQRVAARGLRCRHVRHLPGARSAAATTGRRRCARRGPRS